MRRKISMAILLGMVALAACTPKQPVEFREVEDVQLKDGKPPELTAQAVFYNPNRAHGKIKSMKVSIYVNDKLAGHIDEAPNMSIKGLSEFKMPMTVMLEMDKSGFLDTVLGVLGAKKFNVHFKGSIHVSYGGVPFRVPVDYTKEVKLEL